jgi:DNA (cytosine-5)-methyltransferase 1
VFVVGYLGNWRPAAAVLFERHSLCGYPAPSREKREGVASTITTRTGVSRNNYEECVSTFSTPAIGSIKEDVLSSCITKNTGGGKETQNPAFVLQPIALAENTIGRKPENGGNGDGFADGGPMYTLNATGVHGVAQPLPFDTTQITSPQNGNNPKAGDPCHPLAAGAHPPAIAQTMAFPWQSALDPIGNPTDLSGTLVKNQTMAVAQAMAVRRLTPVECERLQGFPDGYTDIQLKGKATPDGPRYKALGNSMAVPVMAWIGKRIQQVEDILG